MYFTYLVMIAIGILTSNCGNEVEDRRRVVYVDEEGKVVNDQDANASEGEQPENPSEGPIVVVPVQPPGTSLVGAITSINALGLVVGWAVDDKETAESLEVSFYIGDNDSAGTLVGQAVANLSGFDNNYEGNHRFEFSLPEAYRDGNQQKLYVVMKGSGQEGPLTPQAKTYTAYAPSAAGQNFYQAQVRPALNNCQGCHPNEVNYDNHFRLMLDKSPADGGTVVNNRLILKASGGLNHGGNNRCGGINNGACALFQQWWNLEFGS